ncbi:MAG: HD domain-containing protein [Actinobacteria bacterium]|nr:HD domain-containing protein [Actinomycetota bacterium]MBU1945230.1 HD domain-containing protein [Actinomycetota bacterium]MBU2687802.1 HD domain-containing protein [Actinomycetota bacterium]
MNRDDETGRSTGREPAPEGRKAGKGRRKTSRARDRKTVFENLEPLEPWETAEVRQEMELSDEIAELATELETEGTQVAEPGGSTRATTPAPTGEKTVPELEPEDEAREPAGPRRPARERERRERVSRGLPTGGGMALVLPVTGVVAFAFLVLSLIFTRFGSIDYSNLLFWFLVFTAAALLSLELKGGGSISLGLAPLLGAMLALPVKLPDVTYQNMSYSGCVEVMWVFLAGTIVVFLTTMVTHVHKEDFVGMLLDYIGVGFAATVFFLVVKVLPKKPILTGNYSPTVLIGIALAAAVLFVFFLAKESYVLSSEGYYATGVYFRSTLRKSWLPFLILGFTGVLMGLVFIGIGIWSVLFILPLLVVYWFAYHRVAATEQLLLETIRVLSAIPEGTGLVPPGHSQRVAAIAAGVAGELGLAPEDVKQVEYAGYLHDIGAINRAGAPVDQLELASAEGVISGGVDILGKVEYLDVAAEILGGREGLRDRVTDVDKRRAVSLGSGILSAVDDFESLLRGSPDREPLGEQDALTEMNLERGVRYDSKVLRAIARVITRMPRESETIAEGSPESSSFWGEQEDSGP